MAAPLKKILVTGAGGMLGTDLCEILGSAYELLGVGRKPAPHLSVSFKQIDLLDATKTQALLSSFAPDLIFHCAAMTDVDGCEGKPEEARLYNVQMTQNLVQAANQTGAHLLFFSTDYVFDGAKKGAYVEEDPIHPINKYGESKANAEKYIQEFARAYSIFRISWLYGLRGKSFPKTIWEKGKTQKKFQVVCDQIGRPTYSRDLALGFRDLLKQQSFLEKINKQIFHMTNQGETSWAGFASFILRESGHPDAVVEPILSEDLTRPAKRPKNSVLSTEKILKKLGLQMRPWESAAQDFVQILQQETCTNN